jgi:hypothetical protein
MAYVAQDQCEVFQGMSYQYKIFVLFKVSNFLDNKNDDNDSITSYR